MALKVEDLPLAGSGGLVDLFKKISDPRSRFGKRHTLHGMLSLAYCAMLCGAKSFAAIVDWSEHLTPEEIERFDFGRHGIPSGSILQKTFRFLNLIEIEELFTDWFSQQPGLKEKWIAIDGKTLRGAKQSNGRGLHLIAALLHDEKTIIAQQAVGEKTNEIPAAKELLRNMGNIQGSIVTLDALHTHDETARVIVKEKKADYVMIVKDNQKKTEGENRANRL